MTIKIAGTVPAEHNGLSTIHGQLINDPQAQHVIIAVIDTSKLTTDIRQVAR